MRHVCRASERGRSVRRPDGVMSPPSSLFLSLSDLLSYSLFIEIGNKMVERAARGAPFTSRRDTKVPFKDSTGNGFTQENGGRSPRWPGRHT